MSETPIGIIALSDGGGSAIRSTVAWLMDIEQKFGDVTLRVEDDLSISGKVGLGTWQPVSRAALRDAYGADSRVWAWLAERGIPRLLSSASQIDAADGSTMRVVLRLPNRTLRTLDELVQKAREGDSLASRATVVARAIDAAAVIALTTPAGTETPR